MEKPATKAVILMNLGSPDSPTAKDLKRYLNQFLMDKRVIDIHWLLRVLLVRGIIVPFRAPRSAEAYRKIWMKEGSPLVVITELLSRALQREVGLPVEMAMRYGDPDPEEAFASLLKTNPQLQEVVVVPLYPHYAMSSYETAVAYAKEIYAKRAYPFTLTFTGPFYNNPGYLEALSGSIAPFLSRPYDRILFSYHGIPERHIRKSDTTASHCLKSPGCCETRSPAHSHCYRHQVLATTRMISRMLQIPEENCEVSFQSRLGKGWLTPFTDIRLQELPGEGVKNLLILCPAFVSDCLETLEEIEIRGRKTFMEAGGESFTMIPCLNTAPLWVKALSAIVVA
jgi:ferrochelatase